MRLFAALPAPARRALWGALGPSLSDPLPPAVEGLLDDFCRRFGAPEDVLARIIKGCRFLVREAAKLDLTLAAFAEDVEAVAGAHSELGAVLAAGYEQGKAHVRREMLREALGAHGAVFTGMSWRVDTMTVSSSGVRMRAPVVMMTLSYVEGDRPARITLQLPKGAVEELKKACEEILKQ
jgi:hypothetical protein